MNRFEILEAFHALPEYRRFEALRLACADSLEVWRRYRTDGRPLEYVDGVVGMRHVVDDRLPERALDEIDGCLRGETIDPAQTDNDYSEPIVAMQDDDLDVPLTIAQAYYAIYNLYRIVFRLPHAAEHQVVLGQVASSLDVDMDDWVREWWTRTWDTWASLPELAYEPSGMTERVFERLCAGELDGALAELDGTSCLRAVLLALIGRRDEAVAVALDALATDSLDVRNWLADNVCSLAPDAIAVSNDSTRYAVILGERLVIRDVAGAMVTSRTFADTYLRLVRWARNPPHDDVVWAAGDCVDRVGVWATFCDGVDPRQPAAPPPPFKKIRFERWGRRTIAALGNRGEIVARHESEVILVMRHGAHVIGASKVIGAAVHPDGLCVVTFDEHCVSMWPGPRLQPTDQRAFRVVEGAARRVLLNDKDDYALVVWASGTASFHELTD